MLNFFKVIIIFLFIIFSQLFALGQNDSLNITCFPEKITIVPFYQKTGMFLKFKGDTESLSYQPNSQNSIGIELRYKSLGIVLAYGVFEDENDIFAAKVVNYDFRFNFFYRRILITSNFQFYKGFSISADVDESINTDNLTPNLRMFNLGVNVFVALNQNFSFTAVYKNDERIESSRGSIIGGLSQIFTQLRAKSSVYPDSIRTETHGDGLGNFYSLFMAGGYQYAFVYKRWYFAPLGIIGAGLQRQYYSYRDINEKTEYNPAYKYILNIPFGYNGDKFFVGINYSIDSSQMLFESSKMRMKYSSIVLSLGMRFL